MSVIETKIMINSQDFKKNEKDHLELIDEFRNLAKSLNSENTWTLDIKDINQEILDLGVVNPHIKKEALPEPSDILNEIEKLEKESSTLLKQIKKLI